MKDYSFINNENDWTYDKTGINASMNDVSALNDNNEMNDFSQ
jgi:hypothetical protein